MEVFTGLVLVLIWAGCSGQWMTQYDQHFKIECPENQAIKSLESEHDNYYEDRVWNMVCASAPNEIQLGACEWSGYVNNYDELLAYQCPNEGIIAGIEAVHDNYKEDRQFSFKCCVANGAVTHGCEYTPYVNAYDQLLNYRVPDGYVLRGVNAVNDNYHEDRIFMFDICKLDRATAVGR